MMFHALQVNIASSLLFCSAYTGLTTAYEFAEHAWLGHSLDLKWYDGSTHAANGTIFTLENGLQVPYGYIHALAGDFFGSIPPITDADDFEEQVARFTHAFATLGIDVSGKEDALRSMNIKSKEVTLFNQAVHQGQDPSQGVYLHDVKLMRDNFINALDDVFNREHKGYLKLAHYSFDHFGHDAHDAYRAGHTAALRRAASNQDNETLIEAYAMDAFADHYLEDSFAPGHIRTPRRVLHGKVRVDKDLCSWFMHDEDNALGIHVENRDGKKWTIYGDKKLLDECSQEHRALCNVALMASTEEIHNAWTSGVVPDANTFAAWKFMPIINSAFSDQNHAPLFNDKGHPRKDVDDRWRRDYKGWWTFTYPTTLLKLKLSKSFKEPIHF
ncbi:MAG: hypothetical protein M1828_000865 [Chrysothrix sp. TS-e1954]|nr:MAG: hypothetical protein M1828_000865 [Chrysothrix sp. TS-e1954]